jgi:hemerythrin
MKEFEWKPIYDLGIEPIDAQHRTIMEKFRLLHEAIVGKAKPELIVSLMNELLAQARRHFHDEEELFVATDYPQLEAQRAAHREFSLKAESFYRAYALDPVIDPTIIVAFLRDWIENHMLTQDRDFKEFMVRLELLNKMKG